MKKQNKKGFTLVELVIVIAVIAILAGVLIGTFATVISRANQSKALQEWKAAVDESYVEYVAVEHEVPKFIEYTTSSVTFKTTSTTGKALPTVTYTVAENTVTVDHEYNSFVVLDETNKIYFLWNTDGTYAVVATNTALENSDPMIGSYTGTSGTDAAEQSGTFKTLSYNNVTYYGAFTAE